MTRLRRFRRQNFSRSRKTSSCEGAGCRLSTRLMSTVEIGRGFAQVRHKKPLACETALAHSFDTNSSVRRSSADCRTRLIHRRGECRPMETTLGRIDRPGDKPLMARKKKEPTPGFPELEAHRHQDSRKNIPTEELRDFVARE